MKDLPDLIKKDIETLALNMARAAILEKQKVEYQGRVEQARERLKRGLLDSASFLMLKELNG